METCDHCPEAASIQIIAMVSGKPHLTQSACVSHINYLDDIPTPRPGITLTRDQIEAWAGRSLTNDEIATLDNAIPLSSIPEAINQIVGGMEDDA
ncbi:hypothetical protein [Nonomuraea sp. SYSU D8015]|uniref:hypothetical protein n=1 Tax=Nonomuraea sp. SYSU D8015 TaxID=2593644 RepID=UPI0016605B31|nr:hypothetical protein [Nonomuraea sp. SYSU D8015]